MQHDRDRNAVRRRGAGLRHGASTRSLIAVREGDLAKKRKSQNKLNCRFHFFSPIVLISIDVQGHRRIY